MKKLIMLLALAGLLAGCAEREHKAAGVEVRTNHSTNSLTITTNSTP